jgi:hypothetical protein
VTQIGHQPNFGLQMHKNEVGHANWIMLSRLSKKKNLTAALLRKKKKKLPFVGVVLCKR